MIEELKKYALHVEFPIYVDDRENAETIVDSGYDFNFVDYLNPFYKQYADKLNPYVIDLEKEGIEGVKGKLIFMFLRDENGGYGFESENLSVLGYKGGHLFEKFGRITQTERGFLSQDGILIKKSGGLDFPLKNILPLWIKGDFIFFDVNLEDESKIDLTIDRNNVVVNEKLNNLRTIIEKVIIDSLEKLFSKKHLVTDEDKNRFMECFFSTFCSRFTLPAIPKFFLERMNELVIFECSVNGELKYLTYSELKDHWKYFYFIDEEKNSEDLKKAIEKAYPKDPIIYYAPPKTLPYLLRAFGGDHIIVTNKELGHSVDKYLLMPSAGKREKKEKEYAFTFEGDYNDCFGTLLPDPFQIELNINHPFVRLVNKNRDKFKGEDKKGHEFFIDALSEIRSVASYLKPLKEIQGIQKYLLDFYVEKGILAKEEAERYLLTEKDFCPYDMGEDFLK